MPDCVRELPGYGDLEKRSIYVGPMLMSKSEGRISGQNSLKQRQWIDDPFPFDRLGEWEAEGRKIVYAAFGTVATAPYFWNYDGELPPLASSPPLTLSLPPSFWGCHHDHHRPTDDVSTILSLQVT